MAHFLPQPQTQASAPFYEDTDSQKWHATEMTPVLATHPSDMPCHSGHQAGGGSCHHRTGFFPGYWDTMTVGVLLWGCRTLGRGCLWWWRVAAAFGRWFFPALYSAGLRFEQDKTMVHAHPQLFSQGTAPFYKDTDPKLRLQESGRVQGLLLVMEGGCSIVCCPAFDIHRPRQGAVRTTVHSHPLHPLLLRQRDFSCFVQSLSAEARKHSHPQAAPRHQRTGSCRLPTTMTNWIFAPIVHCVWNISWNKIFWLMNH